MQRETTIERLTPKQERFVQEYVDCLNATKAAIAAGYSRRTARQIGYENLTKPYIRRAVARIREAYSRRVDIDRDWVIAEYLAMYYDARGKRRLGAARHCLNSMAEILGLYPQ
jgi:phage terminase small subunit|tara:strand:+ start:989 stop:1327 length:339 start_codon:yes stop_codon:yes gene_type:complete